LQSPDQLPVTSILQSTETNTDLTAVGEVPELAESGPAAGDEHFAVWTELAPAHRPSIHNLTGLEANRN
jgi:hypothetical protein